MLSLLAFGVIAAAGVRSFWTVDSWMHGDRRVVGMALGRGRAYVSLPIEVNVQQSSDAKLFETHSAIFPVAFVNKVYHLPSGDLRQHAVWVQLWFPLLLLLIIPMCWLVARPANAPAFPVITDGKPSK
ncbi:MAG TPA: hypothetical protein VFW23_11290 [Tepidisphaeraceae bacterium]|nr:hypothetical protein [Tepidisphaeraceae bacterium]